MPINVFPWPPVGAVGSEWTEDAPVARLRSLMTGRDQMQASQRRRRIATLQVSALARGRMGAGYSEMLKQLLEGGIHAVRLQSTPINWWLDEQARQELGFDSGPFDWRAGGGPNPLAWQTGSGPNRLLFLTGSAVVAGTVTASGLFANMPLTGLPPRTRIAAPGDFIRIYDLADATRWEVARVVREAVTTASGTVTLRLDRVPSITGGRVNLTGQDEGVFRVDGPLPRAMQTVSGDWSYTWSFREVFADEVGGFTERPGTWT
ncbi:hypothetical protein [Paracoccus aminophilus]|uniref:Uncharacterized protein n=1 Tax=Paracoccus aminophilus JCM 7686 TaxID=1367847 RepID=S5Y968_PARAH|nr:hypothetical protein [Paracoccus aminophilus]AGT07908.1 hypothetical protein JCM7686_0799 [Paracoccus aminophilus JCM 7686]